MENEQNRGNWEGMIEFVAQKIGSATGHKDQASLQSLSAQVVSEIASEVSAETASEVASEAAAETAAEVTSEAASPATKT
jgi:hypothetical protein